jgi:hypothetical protein
MGARQLVRIIVVSTIIITRTLCFPSQTPCASHHRVLVVPDEDTFRFPTKTPLGAGPLIRDVNHGKSIPQSFFGEENNC